VVFADRQGHIVFPESHQAVRFFPAVLVNAQVDLRGHGIDEPGDLAGRIKGLGIGQIVYQLHKIPCHFVGIVRAALLDIVPAVLILFYE
jgi:hypothetical protein